MASSLMLLVKVKHCCYCLVVKGVNRLGLPGVKRLVFSDTSHEVQMDVSFTAHLDQLIDRLKSAT